MRNYINEIGNFLARRDIKDLTSESLNERFNIKKVDVLILLGSSITYTIKCAIEAYKNNICEKILICGGIGHSTELLRNEVRNHSLYKDIEVEGKSEADIINEIINRYYDLPKDKIIIENQSTNCGDNAKKAIEVLDKEGINYNSLLLIQDPTMQLRSYLSFLKYLKGKDKVIVVNYAPFIPEVNDNIELINEGIDGIWNKDRYLELLMGEIPRLRDDENGYGPKGTGFIEHIYIPSNIEKCYLKLANIIGNGHR